GLASVLLNNRVTASLLEVVPGLPELVTLGKIWYVATNAYAEPRPDVILIDAPASGHAVTLLHSPANFARLTRAGPLYRDALAMQELLDDPDKSAIVFTAIPEEMALSEARDHLALFGRARPVLAVNKIFPRAPTEKGTGKYEMARLYTECRHRREEEALRGLGPFLRIPFFFPEPGTPSIPLRMAEKW
ncbi:MAG: hypothetical protein HUU37_05835, partial [Bdellovibrionales bacterium]|nr:hypothetical protein [Bdellovibrionales bacterium]